MQSTNIGYHSDNLLLKIYEKNFLLPFASLIVESVWTTKAKTFGPAPSL